MFLLFVAFTKTQPLLPRFLADNPTEEPQGNGAFALPDLQGKAGSPGRKPWPRKDSGQITTTNRQVGHLKWWVVKSEGSVPTKYPPQKKSGLRDYIPHDGSMGNLYIYLYMNGFKCMGFPCMVYIQKTHGNPSWLRKKNAPGSPWSRRSPP